MHNNLMDFVCRELEELDRKAESGSLSMSDMQYADLLAHYKKDALAVDGMEGDGRSYSRRGRPYSVDYRNGYSRHDDFTDRLHDLMQDAPDEKTRQDIKRIMDRL